MATKAQLEERVAQLERQVQREERARARRVLKVLKVARQNEWCEQVFEALKVAGEKLPDIYWVEEASERYNYEQQRYVADSWQRDNCTWALTLGEAKDLLSVNSRYGYRYRIYLQPSKGRGKVVWTQPDEDD